MTPTGAIAVSHPGIVVRSITVSDQSFCRALFHEHRGAEFAALDLDARMLAALLDQQFHAQQSAFRYAFPDANHFIIEHHGVAIGQVMTAFRDERTLHMIDIALKGSARGRGIGTTVMNGLERAARAKGATRLTLSVLRGNDGARRFYERLGFRAAADDDTSAHIAMIRPLV